MCMVIARVVKPSNISIYSPSIIYYFEVENSLLHIMLILCSRPLQPFSFRGWYSAHTSIDHTYLVYWLHCRDIQCLGQLTICCVDCVIYENDKIVLGPMLLFTPKLFIVRRDLHVSQRAQFHWKCSVVVSWMNYNSSEHGKDYTDLLCFPEWCDPSLFYFYLSLSFQLGNFMGWQRVYEDCPQHGKHVWHCNCCQLPHCQTIWLKN